MIRPGVQLLAPVVVAVLALAGCQSAPPLVPPASAHPTTAGTCPELAARIVDAVQDYVDSFAGVTAAGIGQTVTLRRSEFFDTTAALRSRGDALGCGGDRLAVLVRAELGRLRGGTPVQDAVAETFRADPLGSVDPSDPTPTDVSVTTAEGLAQALTAAGSGSTIRLAAGTYAFAGPIALLRPITLVGAGIDRTTITSSAGGSAVVFAADGDIALTDLTLRHLGSQAASVVAIAAGGYRIERTRVAGGTESGGAGGYGIVVRPAASPLTAGGASRLLSDVTAVDNAGGGIVIAGGESPTITRATVDGTGGCGLCFVDSAGGTVADARISRAQIGVQIDGASAPTLTRVAIDRPGVGVALTGTGAPRMTGLAVTGPQIGVQATGSGAATLTSGSVRDAREIGVRLSGTSRTTWTDFVVSGATKVGVATVADATLIVTGGEVSTTGDVGLVWGDRARGSAFGLHVRGPNLGLQLAGSVSVSVTDTVVDRSSAAAALVADTSVGEFTRLACGTDAGAAIQVASTAKLTLTQSPTCKVFSG